MVLTIPYPDSLPDALRTSREAFEQEARLAMAMTLFNRGRVTSGQAAMMAGCERVDFLTQTAVFGCGAAMPHVDDLAEDLRNALRHG